MTHSRLRPASHILHPASLPVGHVPLKIRYSPILSEPYLIDNNIFIYYNMVYNQFNFILLVIINIYYTSVNL